MAERAAAAYVRIGGAENRGDYGERVRSLGSAPQIDTFIIGASQFAPIERD